MSPMREGKVPARADSVAGAGVDNEISAEGPADVSADPVSALLVADTENQQPSDVPPENQDLQQLQELYDLMQEEHLESLELARFEGSPVRMWPGRHGDFGSSAEASWAMATEGAA